MKKSSEHKKWKMIKLSVPQMRLLNTFNWKWRTWAEKKKINKILSVSLGKPCIVVLITKGVITLGPLLLSSTVEYYFETFFGEILLVALGLCSWARKEEHARECSHLRLNKYFQSEILRGGEKPVDGSPRQNSHGVNVSIKGMIPLDL